MLRYAMMLLGRAPAAAAALDTQTVTIATTGTAPDRGRGYITSSLGSINDGTSNVYGGVAINSMLVDETSSTFILEIAGTQTRTAWSNLNNVTDGKVLTQASASFSTAGGVSTWSWSGQALNSFFTTSSGAKTVTFS